MRMKAWVVMACGCDVNFEQAYSDSLPDPETDWACVKHGATSVVRAYRRGV